MKKYIKPTIEWIGMENDMLLAASPQPGIDPTTPAGSGVEACSLGDGDSPIVFDMDENTENGDKYWGI